MPMAPPSAGPTPGMLGPAMADAALERLTAEEDALLKSLSRLDPKMLRKSLKSAGMDLWSHEGYLQLSNSAEQGKLLKSLARLDMQLQALRAHQGVHARFMAIRSKYHECHLPLPRLCPGANSSQFMAITATLQLVLRSREHAGTCLRQQLITRLATLATKCLECKGQDGLGLATTTLRLLQAGTVLPLVNHQAAFWRLTDLCLQKPAWAPSPAVGSMRRLPSLQHLGLTESSTAMMRYSECCFHD
eukprot:jgi/Tetstr1/428371/TSEL_018406.t1